MTTSPNRWLIAIAGIFMQIALGAVYAWSVFRIPLTKAYGWSISEVTWAFEITIFVVGFASFAGGLWMRRSGPRPVALTGAVLYGLGMFLTGTAHTLTALYLTYGLIAGAGLGLGYIVPIAVLVKWFPDKRGMITGLAVGGFGAGALVTAPVANSLIGSVGVARTFEILGVAYLCVVVICGLFMQNPPEGDGKGEAEATSGFSLKEALAKWQWYALWLVLFLNTSAGISIISQASPMAQEISHVSAGTAAGLVGLISIANGAGRLLWAWLSDAIGRRAVFLAMFVLQAVMFFLMTTAHQFSTLAALAFVILLCYGGGFGTMPAFCTDYFGARQIGPIYGLMLTAWGFAAVLGPTLIAKIRESTGHYEGALHLLAVVTLVSAVLPLLLRPPTQQSGKATVQEIKNSPTRVESK